MRRRTIGFAAGVVAIAAIDEMLGLAALALCVMIGVAIGIVATVNKASSSAVETHR